MSMHILTHQQLYKTAPAIFAHQPDEQVSDRYGFVPTIDVIDALQSEGWYPVKALQTQSRDQERQGLAKHLVRFRQNPDNQVYVGDSVTELVLTNSHDRSSSHQLYLGLFRLVCSNGMVTPTTQFGHVRVKHGKQIVEHIIEGSLQLATGIPHIAESVDQLRSVLISERESHLFAQASMQLRYGDQWHQESPIPYQALLTPRRREDAEPSLWKVFNLVQENMIKGGLSGKTSIGRNMRTRAIKSVNEDIRLNKALWQLAEGFAELKQHHEDRQLAQGHIIEGNLQMA